MPIISVIVPVYNAQTYLARCIDSILSQTFSDFELILVDDGSPDGSIHICQDCAARDSRIRILRQENQGQSAARNHALAIARGSHICFIDSDDLVHPQLLEILYQGLTETGAAVSMCGFQEAAEPSEAFWQVQRGEFAVLSMDEPTLVSLYDREEYPSWVVWGKLIPRALIENYPFAEGRVYEDNEAACHWLCQGGTLARTHAPLYFYRTNSGGTTKSSFSLKKLDYLWALESIIRFYDSLGYSQMKARFGERYIEAAAQACYGAKNLLEQPETAKELYRRTRRFLKENRIPMTQDQLGSLLDASHPGLVKFYWPMAAACRIWQEQGVLGIVRKLTRKGEP